MSGKNLRVNLVANTSQFKSAMTETSNQIKLLNSEFRSASAETDKYGNRLDATGAKKKQLNGTIEQYRLRIKAIKDEQKHWTAELRKGNITEEQHAQKQQELARRLNNTEAEMKRYEGQLKRLNTEGKSTRITFEQFDKKIRDVGRTMRNVGAQVGITAGIGFMAMKRILGDVINEAKTFEAGMSRVKAISGATADEMKAMDAQALELNKTTVFTAEQAAAGMEKLALAGWKANDIMSAMPGMLDLAAAGALSLDTAADITSDTMQAFSLSADKATHAADVFAYAQANANTNVEQMGEAMKYIAPTANSLGWSLEETSAIVMKLADNGLKGSMATQAFGTSLVKLSAPTPKATKLIKKLGMEFFDAEGKMKPMPEVVAEMEKGLKGMSEKQKAATMDTLIGKNAFKQWQIILKEGSGTLADTTRELENADGAAKDMAETMLDNAHGAIIRMESAISGLKIELGNKLLPTLGKGAEYITNLANKMSEMDESTVQTIAEVALLTTAVLGVTTGVAGLVAGIGAFMAFAGPIGLAIAGGTLLLGGLAAAIYQNELKTKNLAEEQKQAEQDARRYGSGLAEGTREATRGYVDLYEGAKVEMLKLKTMSGEEAEKTKQEVVKAFSDMGDMVVAELEAFADDFDRVVREIYGIYEEAGKERADEISSTIRKQTEEMIKDYTRASEEIGKIINDHGADVSKYSEDVRKTYEANLAIMQEGVGVFAVNYEDALRVRNTIAENSDKILIEEAEKYAKEIEQVHSDAVGSINEQYYDQIGVLEEFKNLYPENAELYDEMMQTLATSTAAEYAKIDRTREESTRLLMENMDTEGELIDFSTGKALERLETEEFVTKGIGGTLEKRTESDEDYFRRWLSTNEDYLNSLGASTEQSLDFIEQSAYDWAISMGKTEKEAKKFAGDIRKSTLEELDKGEKEAEKSGKDKGDAHNKGLESTKKENEKAGKNVTDEANKGLKEGNSESSKAGKDKGDAHRQGLDGTRSANTRLGNLLSSGVSSALGRTTDGGGGSRAGGLFTSGLQSRRKSASSAGTSVARSGERGLRSVSTSGAGSNFVSGFTGSISSGRGSVWTTAWNLGKRALSALSSSIRTASPSKETEKIGDFFGQGFNLAISDSTKEAIKQSREMGRKTLGALSDEINNYKHSFAKVALGIEQNKQALKVEHEFKNNSLENKISSLESVLEKLIDVINKPESNNEQPIVVNISVRNNDDINKIDGMLNDLANERNAAWGGKN